MGPWIHEAPARTDWSGALTESRASSHSARNPENFLRSSLTSPRYLVILKLALHVSSQKLSDHSLPPLQLPHSLWQPQALGAGPVFTGRSPSTFSFLKPFTDALSTVSFLETSLPSLPQPLFLGQFLLLASVSPIHLFLFMTQGTLPERGVGKHLPE